MLKEKQIWVISGLNCQRISVSDTCILFVHTMCVRVMFFCGGKKFYNQCAKICDQHNFNHVIETVHSKFSHLIL